MFEDGKNFVMSRNMLFIKEYEILHSRPCLHDMTLSHVMKGDDLKAAVGILKK